MDKPNILFFLPDQWRPDFLGFLGQYPIRTPHIDALAAGGRVYREAFTPSPLCAPARACLSLGCGYADCSVPNNDFDLPLNRPTYYQRLREVGYHVLGVGKFDLHKGSHFWGDSAEGSYLLDEWGFTGGVDNAGKIDAVEAYKKHGRPWDPYMKYLEQNNWAKIHAEDYAKRDPWLGAEATALPDEAYCDNWIARNGLEALFRIPEGEPWHLVVNFTGPHNPQDVTQVMKQSWENIPFPTAHNNSTNSAEIVNAVRQNYAAMCENIDRNIGLLLQAVADRGESERTLVIFASDHGEMLGDYGLWGKQTWHRASSGIPLILTGCGIKAGTSDALVQLQDLAPTILDFADAEELQGGDARSLRGVVNAGDARDYITCSLNEWSMTYDGKTAEISRPDGRLKARFFDDRCRHELIQ